MTQALIPSLIANTNYDKRLLEIGVYFVGLGALCLLAQAYLPLTWTPVPVTGQTFGVALISLLWGARRGMAILGSYLVLGAIGAPVFALGKAGLMMGPTLGYLVGMFLASYVVGSLSDKGYASTFKSALLSCYAGSAVIFVCGLLGLSFFVDSNLLLSAGLLPFLPGDLLKNTLAAFIYSRARRF